MMQWIITGNIAFISLSHIELWKIGKLENWKSGNWKNSAGARASKYFE
jgi:hypothetical protein